MNIEWFKKNSLFILIAILAFWIFVFTVYDIIFGKNWMIYLIASYIILFVLLVFTFFFLYSKKKRPLPTVDEFEKTLKGGLFHFKCQVCGGIFAIKKSRGNNKKRVKMNCPDCGAIGIIPENPSCIEEEIPEKKSIKKNFRCRNCGEGITVWAEGKDLYGDITVYSCPFCGIKKPLRKF